MTKIRTILKSSKLSDGKQQVLLLLSDRGSRCYFSTGFTASPQEFDEGKEVGRFVQGRGVKTFNVERKEEDGSTKSYTNKEANDKLAELERKASEILKRYNDNHINWGFDMFRSDFVNAPKRQLFYAFAEDVIEKEYRSQGHYGKAAVTEGALASLKEYDAQIDKRSFHDISIPYLNGYIAYCKGRNNSNGTISIRLREIRRIFNIAIRDKVIASELYPFSSGKEDGKVKIPKTELNKTDQYLPFESMKKIAQTTFENPVLERTKHLFLFSYYCRGINWRDMALLKKENLYKATVTDTSTKKSQQVTVLQYKRSKTSGEFDIQVVPSIQRELDWFAENTVTFEDYLLPIISVKIAPDKLNAYLQQIRKRFNRSLKEIAKAVGLPESQQNISIYSARHSFAMTMQDEGKSVEVISQALGHQSVETTKHYLAKFSTTHMARETEIDLLASGAGEEVKTIKVVKKPRKPKEPKFKEAPVQEQE